MLLIAFLGGILTVLSPCILPVVPFLFAGVDRSRRSILLTLGGMVLTFALVSSLAVVSTEWVIQANNTGRHVALIVMGLFALSLISARVGGWLARPFVLLGNRIDPDSRTLSGPLKSVMIGVATGLLWAPCAGPILGVILTSAMLQGANAQTSLLLVACSKEEPPPEPVRPVLSMEVKAADQENLGRFAGTIQARYESNLGFRVPGRIARRAVDVGAEVEKGAFLAVLDPPHQHHPTPPHTQPPTHTHPQHPPPPHTQPHHTHLNTHHIPKPPTSKQHNQQHQYQHNTAQHNQIGRAHD